MIQPSSKLAAIFDIDGTLADVNGRVHFINHANYAGSSKEGWAKFRAGIPTDPVIDPIARTLDAFYLAGYAIVLCTGRSEGDREATTQWMRRHGVPFHALYMREADCFRDDTVVKGELYEKILADGWQPFIVFEDRQRVVDFWRSKGLVCAQVAKGDY